MIDTNVKCAFFKWRESNIRRVCGRIGKEDIFEFPCVNVSTNPEWGIVFILQIK